jgi:hypothetical protein
MMIRRIKKKTLILSLGKEKFSLNNIIQKKELFMDGKGKKNFATSVPPRKLPLFHLNFANWSQQAIVQSPVHPILMHRSVNQFQFNLQPSGNSASLRAFNNL